MSDESERNLRNKFHEFSEERILEQDFCERIRLLLNHPRIDEYCMVDAYYYDFSVIPENINMHRDCYLIYGITLDGEIVSKWVDRWDLDSIYPIVDGKVIEDENMKLSINVHEINFPFRKDLLSMPIPQFIHMNLKKYND